MEITLRPKSGPGKVATALTIVFIIFFSLKIFPGFPLPTFAIYGLGVVSFIAGLIAIIKKDRSAGTFLSALVGLGIIFVFASIGISSLGLFKDFPVKDSLTSAEMGEVSNETVNFGAISQKDGWIYYQDNRDGEDLYKMKSDGTGQTKISDEIIGNYIVSGEWILYNTMLTAEVKQAGGALYKMKTDGSEKVKLVDTGWDAGNVSIQGVWIYFDNNGALYRMKADGTEQSLVAEDTRNIEYISWMYISDYAGPKFRVKLDGSVGTRLN